MKRNQTETAWSAGWFACVVLGLTACGPQVYYPAPPGQNSDPTPVAGSGASEPGIDGGSPQGSRPPASEDMAFEEEQSGDWEDDEAPFVDEDSDLDEERGADDDDDDDEPEDDDADAGIDEDEPPAEEDEPGGGELDCGDLLTQAREFSATHCDACHTGGSRRWNYGWDVDMLVEEGRLVPGDSRSSDYVQRVLSDNMPLPSVMLRPSEEEKDALVLWVDECLEEP